MAGKSTVFRNDLLKLIFQAVAIAGIARDDASPLTSFWISLHTADPMTGNQTTSEVAYTGYVRKELLRSATGWTVTGAVVNPATPVEFPISTGGATQVATFVGIGTNSAGTGKLLFSGALSPNITINTGTVPRIPTTSTLTEV